MLVKRSYFKQKIHIVLCLLGLIPYLLVAYLFVQLRLPWTQTIALLAALIFTFHFAGFYILRRFSDELLSLIAYSQHDDVTEMPIHPSDTGEIFEIKQSFNELVHRLQLGQQKFSDVTIEILKESRKDSEEYRRRLKAIGPYVDPRVLHHVMHEKEGCMELRSENKRVAVLFVDICSFTKTSEELQPHEVVELLNDFFNVAVDIIYHNHGIVDKFIGDAIMATFGLNAPLYQVSVDAVCTGVELQDAAKRLSLTRQKQGKKPFKVRIGINTGLVIAGDIGSLDRMDYTVIGDAVNVASRISDHAGAGGVLISADTYLNCQKFFKVESKGMIKVKNRSQAVEAFAVIEQIDDAFEERKAFLSTMKADAQKFAQLRS